MEQIFALWPTVASLAGDLDKRYQTVASWKTRGSIPAEYDLDLVEAAARRGQKLTLQMLAEARREEAAQ